jgi:serine/threonine protein kinase
MQLKLLSNNKEFYNRIYQNNTDYFCHKSFRQLLICKRKFFTSSMEMLLVDPDKFINNSIKLRSQKASVVVKVKLENRWLILKRFNLSGSLWTRTKRFFFNSKAAVCWHNAHRLSLMQIPTPIPIAFLEKRFGSFHGAAYFISEYIDGHLAKQYFEQINIDQNNLVCIVDKIVDIISRLATKCISHGDLHANNFIIKNNEVYLFDLGGMHQHLIPCRWQRALRKDCRRFLQCWNDNPRLLSIFNKSFRKKDFSKYL